MTTRRGLVPLVQRVELEVMRPKGKPLQELIALYDVHERPRKELSTQRNLRRTYELARALPEYPSPQDVQRWRTELVRSCGLSESTAQLHCWSLQAIYSWGNDAGQSQGNPVALCRFRPVPTQPKAIRRIGAVWPQILAEMPCPRSRLFVGTLRFAGLRRSEALGLTTQDVLERPGSPVSLLVHHQRPAPNSWSCSDLKAKAKSHRVIPCRPELLELVRPVLAMGEPTVRVGHGGGQRLTVPFLCPFRVNDLQRLRHRLMAALPLYFGKGDAWHVLRHSLAVEMMAEGGAEVSDIQAVLGHTVSETTEHYMSALVGQRVREGVFDGLERKKKGPKTCKS